MAPNVTLHVFPHNDLNGSPITTITDEDSYFKSLKLRIERDGLGGAELVLARNADLAAIDPDTFDAEYFVRIILHAYSDTVYYPWGFSWSKRQLVVVHVDEDGGEEFRLGGPGPKQYLTRGVLGIGSPTTGWNLDLANGVWRWGDSATVGTILERIVAQDSNEDDPALPDLTLNFDETDDSNSVAWADTDLSGGDNLYRIPIGTSLLQSLWDLDDVIELSSWIDLGTVATPKYELNVIQGLGDDNTGSAFGAGVCLLKEGDNIANNSLTADGISLKKASHVIVEGADGKWATAERPSFTPGDYVKRVKIEYTRQSSVFWLEKAGIRWLKKQDYAENEVSVQIVPGASDNTGLYFPAPNRVLWLNNIITLVSSADGTSNGHLDYLDTDEQLVTGFEVDLGPAGDTTSADTKAKSWDVTVLLNKERAGTIPKHPDQASSTSGGPGPRCCAPFPIECPPDPGDTLITDTDDSGWLGTLNTGDGFTGQYRFIGGSGGTSAPAATASVSPGDYSITVTLGGSEHKYTGRIWIEDVAAVLPQIVVTFPNAVRAPGGHGTVTSYSQTFEVPTGYDQIRYRHESKMGGWRYQAEIYALSAPPGDGGFCIPEGSGGDPDDDEFPLVPHYNDPRFTATDQHPITRFTQPDMVNGSGSDLVQGDSVIPVLGTENEFTTTTTATQTELPVGILLEDIADGEQGAVAWAGFVNAVTITGTAASGDYLYTTTTPATLDATGTGSDPGAGALGVVLDVDGSGQVTAARWWGIPNTAGGGGGGAPTTADYLVGTAQGGLSAEIVVGTTPGGELGGTWASPTVDATHSGSAHHAESHESRHQDGGADEIDITSLGGFTGSSVTFLRGDATFATPSGGASGTDRVVKTSAEILSNSTTPQADNELTLAVGANKRYGWRANLWFESATAADIKWEMRVPTGATGQFSGMGLNAANVADNEAPTYAYGAGGGTNDAGQGLGTVRHRRFEGFLKTSGTAGNLEVWWAQNSALVSNTQVNEGSNLELWEM